MPTSEYIYGDGTTDAERYLQGCLDGKYVVGRYVKALARKMLAEIRDGYKGYRYDPDKATRPVEWIETFCMLPSGKLGVPFILEPYERMIVELIFGFVDGRGFRRFHEALVVIGRKNGKALSLDTELPTPDGWRRMGDVHVGDYVFGQDGRPSEVLVESEIFDKPTYLVTFEDGSTLKATDDHIWTVTDKDDTLAFAMVAGSARDVTTQDMFDDFEPGRYHVPLCKPVEYGRSRLCAHPYDVGRSVVCRRGAALPREYLDASPWQRRAVASGIEDACREIGTLCPAFDTREAAEGVAELYASIGVFARVFENGGLSFVSVDRTRRTKAITSIERIPNEPSKCIAIDNPSHLYLAGRQYTATHNTALCAALNLYMLTSDGEGAPQCYNAAVNEAQAALCFGATWNMVRQSPKLSKYVKKGVVPDRKTVGLKFAPNLGYLVTVSSRSDALDGLNAHYAVLDELGASRDRATYDLVKGSTGTQDEPLIFCISTQNYVRNNIFDIQRDYAVRWLDGTIEDDHFLGVLYEMDDRQEIYVEDTWPKANPGLIDYGRGSVKKWDYMRGEMRKAQNDPSYMSQVLIKQFNIVANQATAYFTHEEAVNEETYEFDPDVFRYCVVGMDAADSLDLNAATALFMRPGDDHLYSRSMYWIAEEQVAVNSNSQRQRDGVPYDLWAARGLIRIVPGNTVPRRVFVDWIRELAEEGLYTRYIGYDPWRMESIIPDLKMLVGEANVSPVRQGVQTLSDPLKRIKADMRDHRFVNNHNPIDEWCCLNATCKQDINANFQVVKNGHATSRIDGFMARLHAYVAFLRNENDYKQTIGWHPPE